MLKANTKLSWTTAEGKGSLDLDRAPKLQFTRMTAPQRRALGKLVAGGGFTPAALRKLRPAERDALAGVKARIGSRGSPTALIVRFDLKWVRIDEPSRRPRTKVRSKKTKRAARKRRAR